MRLVMAGMNRSPLIVANFLPHQNLGNQFSEKSVYQDSYFIKIKVAIRLIFQ